MHMSSFEALKGGMAVQYLKRVPWQMCTQLEYTSGALDYQLPILEAY